MNFQTQVLADDYTLRKATDEDGEHIRSIVFSSLEEYGLKVNTCSTDRDLFEINAFYKEGLLGVIEFENEIKGCFGLMPVSDHSVELRKMYFDPSIRGKGLGRKVVHILIDLAKQNGYNKMELETASVLKEAIGLYESIGFKPVSLENATPRCDQYFELELK